MLLFQKIITGQRRAGTQSIALLTMAQCILFTPKFYITMVFNFSWVLQSFQEKSKAMVIPFFFSQGAFMISVKTVIARESGFRNRKNLACVQSGVLGFGIGITTQGIRNPANEYNQVSKFHILDPVPGIKIQDCLGFPCPFSLVPIGATR